MNKQEWLDEEEKYEDKEEEEKIKKRLKDLGYLND